MSGNAALVTGAAKRVGRAIALGLATQGYDIILHYHHSAMEAEATRQDILAKGVACELLQGNLAQTEQLSALVEQAFQLMPHCNALINNASSFGRASLGEMTLEHYLQEFAVNLHAPVFLTQAFSRHTNHAVVVNLLDTMINHHQHAHAAYLLAKKSLADFTQMAALEFAPGLRVNGVCPGFLLPSSGWDGDYQAKLQSRLPLGKTAAVENIVEAIWALISNPAITGQLLFVDGGEHLLGSK